MLPNSETYLSRPASKKIYNFRSMVVDFDGFWGVCRQLTPKLRDITCSVVTVGSACALLFLFSMNSKPRNSPLCVVPPVAELSECLDVIVEVFSLFSGIFGVTAACFSSYSSIVETKWLHDFQGRVMPTKTGSQA